MQELEQSTKDKLQAEINQEIAQNKIIFYGKGTKDMPMCGFTIETIQFLSQFGYPFEVVNVLQDMEKRAVLAEMTNWPTLPKVFINGKFYGDTDILGPMAENGELQAILKEAFPEGPSA
jgi:monothiol glutaredoxin